MNKSKEDLCKKEREKKRRFDRGFGERGGEKCLEIEVFKKQVMHNREEKRILF